MGTENNVIFAETAADPCSNSLFTHVGMTGTMYQATLVTASQLFFARPDQEHRTIETQQRFVVQLKSAIGSHSGNS
tara:strand:- start:143 stop:370 length:228 start_codon:yes stop_codon:yes gene_type:complete